MTQIILIPLFSIWLFLTILWQFKSLRSRLKVIRKLNSSRLLPVWTFFCPFPGMFDAHILYRDRRENGDVTEWKEIEFIEPRKLTHLLWNPKKRILKSVLDAIGQISAIHVKAKEEELDDEVIATRIQLSKGHLILLNLVFGQPPTHNDSASRQFVIAKSTFIGGSKSIAPFFYSSYRTF